MTDDSFELRPAEKISEVWLKLKSHLEAQVATLRAQNDSTTLTAEQTAALRGRIAAYKALLDLDRDEQK